MMEGVKVEYWQGVCRDSRDDVEEVGQKGGVDWVGLLKNGVCIFGGIGLELVGWDCWIRGGVYFRFGLFRF